MQKEELLREVAEKKSKIEDMEKKLSDQSSENAQLSLKVEQIQGRTHNLETLKEKLEQQLLKSEEDYEQLLAKKDLLKHEKKEQKVAIKELERQILSRGSQIEQLN